MDNFNSSNLKEFSEALKLISNQTVKASELKKVEEHIQGFIIPFMENIDSLIHYPLTEKDKEMISFLGNILSRNN